MLQKLDTEEGLVTYRARACLCASICLADNGGSDETWTFDDIHTMTDYYWVVERGHIAKAFAKQSYRQQRTIEYNIDDFEVEFRIYFPVALRQLLRWRIAVRRDSSAD